MSFINVLKAFSTLHFSGFSISNILKKAFIPFLILVSSNIAYADYVTPNNQVNTSVNVRLSAKTNSRIIGKLYPGDRAELLRDVKDWYEVLLANGERGFAFKKWLERVVEPIDVDSASIESAPIEYVFPREFDSLLNNLDKIRYAIDNLTTNIDKTRLELKESRQSRGTNLWVIISTSAAALAVIMALATVLISKQKEMQQKEIQRVFFTSSLPSIQQRGGAYYNFIIDLKNEGENPASTLETAISILDRESDDRESEQLSQELFFGTKNPIASKNTISIKKIVKFDDDCPPKLILIKVLYVDSMQNENYEQVFKYCWGGIEHGIIIEDFDHYEE